MKANKNDKVCGIYCIIDKINNKKYVGKSKNIYLRIIEHCYLLKIKSKDENPYLIRAWHKHGRENFTYIILEKLSLNEKVVAERELYWMEHLNTLDRKYGFNLRRESDTKMIVSESTSKKISARLKKEWKAGIRSQHGEKLSQNWQNNPERKEEQSAIMTKNLTKYKYDIFDLENIFIERCTYKRLCELNLKNVMATFYKKKTNKVKFKNYFIERLIIEDIVRYSK
ncbi:MAG: hypothetical protein EOL97_08635 [Spirochaetia bacterium]|nr:hypothetical protein [Spirochaetia bacterium]